MFAYVGSIQNLKDLKDLKDKSSQGLDKQGGGTVETLESSKGLDCLTHGIEHLALTVLYMPY